MRWSHSAWLKDTADPVVRALDQRIAAVTGLDLRPPYAEYLQVVNYGLGGHYEPHFDHATVRELLGWAVGEPWSDAQGGAPGVDSGMLLEVVNGADSGVVPGMFLGMGPGLAFEVIPQMFLKNSWAVPQIFLEMGPGMLLMMVLGWCPREDPEWSLGVPPW